MNSPDSSKSTPTDKPNSGDSLNSTATSQSTAGATQEPTNNKEVKGKVHTFYQVLIDSRDCPYIVSYVNIKKYTTCFLSIIFVFSSVHRRKP